MPQSATLSPRRFVAPRRSCGSQAFVRCSPGVHRRHAAPHSALRRHRLPISRSQSSAASELCQGLPTPLPGEIVHAGWSRATAGQPSTRPTTNQIPTAPPTHAEAPTPPRSHIPPDHRGTPTPTASPHSTPQFPSAVPRTVETLVSLEIPVFKRPSIATAPSLSVAPSRAPSQDLASTIMQSDSERLPEPTDPFFFFTRTGPGHSTDTCGHVHGLRDHSPSVRREAGRLE